MKAPHLVLLLFIFGVALHGCAGKRNYVESGGIIAFDGVSETYPWDAQALAESAAVEIARRYPPGRTGIALISAPGAFSEALEQSLRGHGFALFGAESPGLRMGYVLDEVRGEPEPTAYLQMSVSDGGRFGFVRKLSAMRPVSREQMQPAVEPASSSVASQAPESLTVPSTASGDMSPISMASVRQAEIRPLPDAPEAETVAPVAPQESFLSLESEWSITPGSLREQLRDWSSRAGYQLVWKVQDDLEMETHAAFRGAFIGAVQQLITGLNKGGNHLRVTLYQANNVLEVMEE